MDNICGNAFKISNICRTAFLPRNRYLENAYAAVTAVPIATTIVPTLSITEFFSQSKNGSSTFTFSVTSGTVTPGTSQSTSPAFDVERNGIGNYTITVSDFPTISDTDVTYNITAVSQITLKLGGGENEKLVLNETTFTGKVIAYNNSLVGATAVNLTAKTNYTKDNGVAVTFTNSQNGTWYATGLPEGLNISNDGKIYGMATATQSEIDVKVVIKTVNDREYFGTVKVTVSEAAAQGYTVSLSASEGTLVGSGSAYSIVGDISDLKLTIDGTPVFNGQVSVIDNVSGQRTTIAADESTQDDAVTYTISATGGAGSYTIHIVSPSVGYVNDITLTVYPVTSGTTGAGFVIIGSS